MTVHTIRELLEQHPLCAALDDAHLELLAGCARNVVLTAGTRVLSVGEPADTFYLLRGGRVALEVAAPGRGPLVIETVGAGDVLGWSWLFPPYRWHFDATVVETAPAIALDGVCLRGKCDADPAFGYQILRRIAAVTIDRLQATRIRLLDLYGSVPAG